MTEVNYALTNSDCGSLDQCGDVLAIQVQRLSLKCNHDVYGTSLMLIPSLSDIFCFCDYNK